MKTYPLISTKLMEEDIITTALTGMKVIMNIEDEVIVEAIEVEGIMAQEGVGIKVNIGPIGVAVEDKIAIEEGVEVIGTIKIINKITSLVQVIIKI